MLSASKGAFGGSKISGEPVHELPVPINPLMPTLKLHSNVLLYSSTVISTLAVDGWAVTFGTARRGLGGLGPRPVPYSLYQM